MGFNRRLDHEYRFLYERVREGQIGKVEMIRITSRSFKASDPSTVTFSGGMIRAKTNALFRPCVIDFNFGT